MSKSINPLIKKCPHNDPYCGDCHKKLTFKTKAEERLIRAALRELPSIQPIDPESSFGKAVESVRRERKKK